MWDDIGADIQRGQPLAARLSALEHTKTYDLIAAIPLIVWYGLSVAARLPALAQEIVNIDFGTTDLNAILGLVSKLTTSVFLSTLIALLIFRDKPRAKAKGLTPRIVAVAGTYLGVGMLLLPPVHLSNLLYCTSTLLVIAGTIFALYGALNLGQSISMMSEARRLVVRGPYAVIRHPVYLGEGIVLLGLMLQFFSLSAVLILILQYTCQIIRMNNEEQVLLRAFPQYGDYMAQTARLIPRTY